MEASVVWKDKMCFEGIADGFNFSMDATAPIGHHEGPNPKKVLLASLAACTGMDVIGLLNKNKQKVDHFEIDVSAESTKDHPIVFTSVNLIFKIEGLIDTTLAMKAIELSQTVYCGVCALVAKSTPINWNLFVNDVHIGKGKANFDIFSNALRTSFEG